jgi:hypothetical protein
MNQTSNPMIGITLKSCANEVNLKLINHGVDLMFYVPNDEFVMINIIKDHARFTMQQIQDYVQRSVTLDLYDDYDLDNLADSKMYLLNNIEFVTRQEINPFINENTTGPEVWMRIVGTAQGSTIERLTKVDDLI